MNAGRSADAAARSTDAAPELSPDDDRRASANPTPDPPEIAEELALLNPALGPIEPPVRAVLFGQARFEQHGRSLAQAQAIQGTAGAGQFFPRLDDNVAMLQQTRRLIEKRHRDFRHLGAAGKWLLDNAALIDEQTHQVRRGLPRNFFRLLPRLRDEPLAGLPRIYGVAWAWVAHTDGGFDTGLLAAYLRAYQEERPLSLAELWALPTSFLIDRQGSICNRHTGAMTRDMLEQEIRALL